MREHFELLLRDRDPDVVQFALGAGRYPDDSGLTKRAREFPEQVPITEVRALLNAADPAAIGIAARSVRAVAVSSSSGATNFGEYFVYISFFLDV